MKKSLLKDTVRQIKNTFKRFLSILLIVFLGVGFFAGIRAASPDMKDAVDTYYDSQNMMDLEVISTLGLTEDDIKAIKNIDGVENAVLAHSFDATVKAADKDIVVKVESLPTEINELKIIEGKLPEEQNECVVEESFLIGTKFKIGDYITINPEKTQTDFQSSEEEKQIVKNSDMKIVGTVESPEYISRTRGTSKLGAGTINYYMFIPEENIDMEAYTIAYITVKGAKELETYNKDYQDLVDNVSNKIEWISEERKQARYQEIVDEAEEKLDSAQNEYDTQKKQAEDEINQAQKQLEEAKNKVESGKTELEKSKKSSKSEFEKAEANLTSGEEQLRKAKEEYESKKDEANKQIEEAEQKIKRLKEIQENYTTLKDQATKLEESISGINKTLEQLKQDETTNAVKIAELEKQKVELNAALEKVNASISMIENSCTQQGFEVDGISAMVASIESQVQYARNQLNDAETKIKNTENELAQGRKKLKSSRNEVNKKLATAQAELEQAEAEINENENKLNDAKKEMEEKLEDAQQKLNDAKLQIEKIEKPKWYILDRNSNYGYAEYIQDTDRIGNLAKVFPLVFFLVAALISLTSMSRMIEEQRVQIGTLKALGYNKLNISMKYIIYALLATIIGGVLGMIVGFKMLPQIIYSMYAMMYTLPGIDCKFQIDIGVLGLFAALACTLGATIYTCIKELSEKPATLMLPRAPKPGKRILLERIKFVWNKMKFTQKVTARNIFRYKKKFLMTIVGVAGCTALIITGFGIRDAVSKMIPSQYGEIFKYDSIVSLKDDISNKQIEEELNKIQELNNIDNTISCYMKTVEITNIKNSQTLNLVVFKENQDFSEFITLKPRSGKENYKLQNDSVIISEKIASNLKIKVGDTITIKNTDDIEKDIKVGAITENYLYHYIYMTDGLFNELYGENAYKPNTILIKENTAISENDEEEIGRQILSDTEKVSGVTFLSKTKDIFGDVMDKMQLVVYILIIAAGLLAFAVLYNLSNVNISERVRELATIKVLGFYDKEVFDYVIKETRILTAIGILLGMLGGYFLTMYIIKTCELDMLMFDKRIGIMSFVYGIIITVVFAEIVNIAVNRTLKKINMADSLKSVD